MRSSIQVSLFTLVIILSTVRATRAEPGAVLVSGTAKDQQQLIALRHVAAAMREAGWSVDDKAYNASESATAARCLRETAPWTCISTILHDKQIQRAAVVSLDLRPGKNGSTDTVISERLVFANRDSLFVAQRFCNYCTDDKVATLAAELTKELIDRAAIDSGRTVLEVKSVPRGAKAYVDSNLVGITDISVSTVPGEHTITVELDGHEPATRHVTISQDTTQEVPFTLQPTPRPRIEPKSAGTPRCSSNAGPCTDSPNVRRWRIASKTLTGAGLLAFVGGIVLVALDEDPVTRPDQEASRRYFDSATGGVILGAGGLVAAGIGGYLWWKYSRSSSAPAVVPVNGGAVVGVTHAF